MRSEFNAKILKTCTRAMLALVIAGAIHPAARANTYLYSYTTDELLSLVQASAPTDFTLKAYFGFYIRPKLDAADYTVTSVTSPKPSGIGPWDSAVLDSSLAPEVGLPGQFAQFWKKPGDASVTIATVNFPLFDGVDFANSAGPGADDYVHWGTTLASMDYQLAGNAVFAFTIDTLAVTRPQLEGIALALFQDPFLGTKLEANYFATPEPGTLALASAGIFLAGLLRSRSRRTRG